ncbi:hypothetical protein LCGC14_1931140, partial [marine sediment metagenome]
KNDIEERGQLVPIVVKGSEVIDGRKRLRACEELEIDVQVIEVAPDDDPETLARSLNELRTHYSPSQLAMMAARRTNLKRGQTVYRPGTIAELSDGGPRSAKQVANEVGVGRALVQEAKSVLRDAVPEVIQAVEAGKLTLHAAKNIINAVPKDGQADAVSAVLEASKGKSRHSSAAVLVNQKTSKDPRPQFLRDAARSIRKAKKLSKGNKPSKRFEESEMNILLKTIRRLIRRLEEADGDHETT